MNLVVAISSGGAPPRSRTSSAARASSTASPARRVEKGSPEAEEIGERLRALYVSGFEAWDGIELDEETFAKHVIARLEDEGLDADALGALHGDDLYLACACLHRVPGANAAFESAQREELDRVFGRLRRRGTDPADVRQQLLARLLVGDERKPAAIRSYSGRGALRAWVRVAATRLRIDFERQPRGREEPIGEDRRDQLVDAPDHDPELLFLKETYREEFRRAFAAAVDGLQPRERALLRLNLVEHLSATQIAAVYRVHRATAKRWLAAAREELLTATRGEMSKNLGVDTVELDSIMRLIESRFEVSVKRVLGTEAAPGS